MIADNVKSWATKVSVFDMSGGYIGSGFFLEENKDIETCLVDIKGKQLVYNVKEYNIVKFGDPKPSAVIQAEELPLRLVSKGTYKMETGDVFLWRNGKGVLSIHTFHSDSGFGAKTYTDFDDVNGSSLIVNYSGICGVLETINEDR